MEGFHPEIIQGFSAEPLQAVPPQDPGSWHSSWWWHSVTSEALIPHDPRFLKGTRISTLRTIVFQALLFAKKVITIIIAADLL